MGGERIIIIVVSIIITGLTDDSVLRKGVVFIGQGNFLLTTSRWTLVVEISFEEYDIQLLKMREHMDSLKQLAREVQMATTRSSYWNYTAAEIENLDRVLIEQDAEYRDLKSLVTLDPAFRGKRALIDLGGELLKFLFGTATSREVEDLNDRISRLETDQESIVHILDAQATVLNETLSAIKDNCRHIKMLLKRQELLSKIMQAQSYSLFVSTALRYMESAVTEFRSQLTNLRSAIEILEQGRLSSYFVSRRTLLATLTDINNHLPNDISLIEPVRPDNLFKYYQWITVTAIARPNTLRLFIDIPLVNPDQFFDLFEIVSFPVYYPNINIFAYYRTDYTFIALSKNRQAYILLNTYEVLKCRSGTVSICAPESPIWRHPYQSCEYSLFMGHDILVNRFCEKRVTATHPPVFRRLDNSGTWLYATDKPLSLVIKCPGLRGTPEQSRITKLIGTNIVTLGNSCKGYLPGIELTSHFQQRSTWKITAKTPMIFPLLAEILNRSEVNLIQVYKNATTQAVEVEHSPTDISLKTAEITLHDIKAHINKLKQSILNQYPNETHYFKDMALGISGILVIAVFVLVLLFRKRRRGICECHTNDPGTETVTSSPETREVMCSASPCVPENIGETSKVVQRPKTVEETHTLPTEINMITRGQVEPQLSPDLRLVEETPLRI